MFLLGCILNNPKLLLKDKYRLSQYDFKPCKFHQILYAICNNLIGRGCKVISEVEILEFCKPYEVQLNILESNNIVDFIPSIKKITKESNIDLYYQNVRKFSLLRMYEENGFDISEFYNKDNNENTERSKLDGYSMSDIVNKLEGKQISIRREYVNDSKITEYKAGNDAAETVEGFKESPLTGDSLQSPFLNAIFRGMYGFLLIAGKSGLGKTTITVGDCCKVSCIMYWDKKENEFVKNKSRVGASLFINTEMDLKKQIDILFLAWISDVPRNIIVDGTYTGNQEQRVKYAIDVLKESDIYIVDDPEFTTKSLRATMIEYKEKYDVKNVFFDYIENNGFVATEIATETKIPQREDMVLLEITRRLKQTQREIGVGLLCGVQTNSQEDNMLYPTESVLAGGKAQVRKADGVRVLRYPTKAELEQTMSLWKREDFTEMQPNCVTHIVKGRESQYPRYTKVFQYNDLGTGRVYDLFCTDKDNFPIRIEKRYIYAN